MKSLIFDYTKSELYITATKSSSLYMLKLNLENVIEIEVESRSDMASAIKPRCLEITSNGPERMVVSGHGSGCIQISMFKDGKLRPLCKNYSTNNRCL